LNISIKNKNKRVVTDILIYFFILIVLIYFYWNAGEALSSFRSNKMLSHGIGPALVPRTLAVIGILITLYLFIRSFKNRGLTEGAKKVNILNKSFWRVLLTFGGLIIYVLGAFIIGFRVSTFIFLFIMISHLGSKNNVIICAIVSLLVSFIVFYSFLLIFNIILP